MEIDVNFMQFVQLPNIIVFVSFRFEISKKIAKCTNKNKKPTLHFLKARNIVIKVHNSQLFDSILKVL